jgi:leucine dehydrogenase
MTISDHPEFDGHEDVAFHHDPDSGLDAIIAIHNTSRGPALGGCRMWAYESRDQALTDVLRLSRGMTYKSALAGLHYGGGKAVIIGDPRRAKSETLFRAMGRFVESLNGRYIVAEDVGISVADVEAMARETGHVSGIPARGAGDPSPATAYGVYRGIKAAVRHKLGLETLKGLRVAVQGLGHVGTHLCRQLAAEGAGLIVADLDPDAVRRAVDAFDARAVPPDEIVSAPAEVFAPCALGAVIDDRSIETLKATIVAGAANNQLALPRHGPALARRGVLYAPDYVINAGGIILISHEGAGFDRPKAFAQVALIHDTLLEIFQLAEAAGTCTAEAADRLAERRFTRPATASAAA